MTSNNNYTFSIIGAGQISAGYDSLSSKNILTHAHAIHSVKCTKLLGFYDKNFSKSLFASNKWNCKANKNISDLISDSPDVLIVCVPDANHYEVLKKIVSLDYLPKLVICEKPLTDNFDLSKDIYLQYKNKGIPLWTNYQRRLDDNFKNISFQFKSGNLGSFLTGSMIYAKGLKHNGSHGIDLVLNILGTPEKFLIAEKRYDFYQNDPTISGCLLFKNSIFNLQAADENFYSIFEIDLLFQNARFKFFNSASKLTVQKPKKDPNFTKYVELLEQETVNTEFLFCLKKLIIHSIDFLNGNITESICDSLSAIETQRLCEKLSNTDINNFYNFEKI